MIANFFRKSKPINTLLIIALLFCVYVITTLTSYQGAFGFYFFLKWMLYFVLLLVTLFGVNFIITKNNLTKDNSYAVLLYVLLIGIFSLSILEYKLVITNLILFFAYRRIYSLRTTKNTEEKLFDSALFIGMSTLIYAWSSVLIILVFIALFLFDRLTWRNVLIPIVGFICPIFIYGVYLIAVDNFNLFDTILNFNSSFSFKPYNSFKVLVPLSFTCGLIIWSIFPTTLKITTINNEFRSSWSLLVTHFFLLIFVILPWPNKNGSELMFLFFPISIIFTNYLQIVEEKWFKDVFLYCFLALVITTYIL